MKVLSLFDGISCARVALKKLNIPVEKYYASEIDKYAIQISQKNWRDVEHVGNVEMLRGGYFENIGIDLLIGGSPCQDLSIAKAGRQGLKGARSGLFWEYVRMLKEVKPKYFILENVASMSKEDKAIITETLGVEPIMIDAALVSGQQRKRYFWTNIPGVVLPQDKGIMLKDVIEDGVALRDKSLCIDANYYKGGSLNKMLEALQDGRALRQSESRLMVYVGHLGEKNSMGNRVYSIEGKSKTLSANGGGWGAKTGLYIMPVALRNRGDGKQPEFNKTGKANALTTVRTDSMVAIIPEATKQGYAVAEPGDSVDLSFPSSLTRRGRVGKKAKNLMTSNNVGVFEVIDGEPIIRKLSPVECERLQSLPDGYTNVVSNTQRYKACGNAFNVDVVAHILSFIKG